MAYRKKINCAKTNLKQIRSFVSDVLSKYRLSEPEANLIVLAIDEVCTNMIVHSHQCNPEESLEVVINRKKDGFLFEIRDKGELFDILQYQEPDIKQVVRENRRGSMGLILVKKIMDRIECTTNHKGDNVCRLFKQTSAAG